MAIPLFEIRLRPRNPDTRVPLWHRSQGPRNSNLPVAHQNALLPGSSNDHALCDLPGLKGDKPIALLEYDLGLGDLAIILEERLELAGRGGSGQVSNKNSGIKVTIGAASGSFPAAIDWGVEGVLFAFGRK